MELRRSGPDRLRTVRGEMANDHRWKNGAGRSQMCFGRQQRSPLGGRRVNFLRVIATPSVPPRVPTAPAEARSTRARPTSLLPSPCANQTEAYAISCAYRDSRGPMVRCARAAQEAASQSRLRGADDLRACVRRESWTCGTKVTPEATPHNREYLTTVQGLFRADAAAGRKVMTAFGGRCVPMRISSPLTSSQ